MTNQKTWTLSSGAQCRLVAPDVPLAPDLRVLSLEPEGAEASSADVAEVLALAHRLGRELGRCRHGDPECFTLMVNGRRSGRRPWLHVHILPARSPSDKHRLLLLMALKRVFRAVRSMVGRWVGGSWLAQKAFTGMHHSDHDPVKEPTGAPFAPAGEVVTPRRCTPPVAAVASIVTHTEASGSRPPDAERAGSRTVGHHG